MRTRLSSKGQLVLPKEVRAKQGWKEGTEIEVEETPGGVLLRLVDSARGSSLPDLLGCTGYRGPRVSVERMDAAIARGAPRTNRR
jgi:AbrB family looped-hinge helix DNA binding protein